MRLILGSVWILVYLRAQAPRGILRPRIVHLILFQAPDAANDSPSGIFHHRTSDAKLYNIDAR